MLKAKDCSMDNHCIALSNEGIKNLIKNKEDNNIKINRGFLDKKNNLLFYTYNNTTNKTLNLTKKILNLEKDELTYKYVNNWGNNGCGWLFNKLSITTGSCGFGSCRENGLGKFKSKY